MRRTIPPESDTSLKFDESIFGNRLTTSANVTRMTHTDPADEIEDIIMVDLSHTPFNLDREAIDWVESTIASMTLDEKIGQ